MNFKDFVLCAGCLQHHSLLLLTLEVLPQGASCHLVWCLCGRRCGSLVCWDSAGQLPTWLPCQGLYRLTSVRVASSCHHKKDLTFSTMILTHQVSYCAHTHRLRGWSFKKGAFILAGFQLHTDGSQADKTPPGHPHESPAETGQLPWLDVSVHHLPLVPCGSPVCESLIVLRS